MTRASNNNVTYLESHTSISIITYYSATLSYSLYFQLIFSKSWQVLEIFYRSLKPYVVQTTKIDVGTYHICNASIFQIQIVKMVARDWGKFVIFGFLLMVPVNYWKLRDEKNGKQKTILLDSHFVCKEPKDLLEISFNKV